ncbi:substrate-binding domain-containing protein [Beijerinckia sp. L45]|uniref:substrate-binding domain-containing protein n=1 Tax=Beijerinckia sp. L45 TaxID=1641855 RepID=UPI00131DDAD6|nr:substrate-binding domain-containing protein [Beijerinckia sp. L45]
MTKAKIGTLAWRHAASAKGRIGLVALTALALLSSTKSHGAMAAPVKIYAAGSLKAAMQALIQDSGISAESMAEPVFGPAGTLRERLEKGETADLFASADMAQPMALAATRPQSLIVPFVRNRMCVVARSSVGLTAANVLDKLLAPDLRLATSTPVADPGGDYAMAVFDKADQIRPGAGATLRAKAQHLLGAPGKMAPIAGKNPAAAIFLENRADALIYYCSGAPGLLKEVDGLASLPLPEPLEVHPVYGLTILSDKPVAARFALFVVSVKGQAILSRFGFVPLTAQ